MPSPSYMGGYEVAGSCVLIIALVAHLVLLFKSGTFSRWLQGAVAAPSRLWAAVCSVHGPEPSTELKGQKAVQAQKVANLVQMRQVKLARGFLTPMASWGSLVAVSILIQFFFHMDRWMSMQSDIIFMIFYLEVLLLNFKLELLNTRSLPQWTSLNMALAALAVSPAIIPKRSLTLMTLPTLMFRQTLGLTMPTFDFAIWNIIYGICVVAHYFVDRGPEETCFSMSIDSNLVSLQVTTTAAIVLVSMNVQNVLRAEASQQVEAAAAHSGQEAARSLLGTICDAVVELDVDLCVIEHSPSLPALLLHGSNHSLIATKFEQFMFAEEDKDHFNSQLRVPVHERGAMAKAFHLKVRDSLGSAIKVEMFHVCFLDGLTELPQHLVGLLEQGDPGVPQQNILDVSETEMAPLMGSSMLERHSEVAVIFDAVSFEILRCSDAFSAHFGVCRPGTLFSDWMSKEDATFQTFCEHVNNFACGDQPTSSFELSAVQLLLPTADQAVSRKAAFTLVTQPEEEEEGEERVLACMVLHGDGLPPLHTDFPFAEVIGNVHSGSSGPSSVRSGASRSKGMTSCQQQDCKCIGRGTAMDAGPRRKIGEAPSPPEAPSLREARTPREAPSPRTTTRTVL